MESDQVGCLHLGSDVTSDGSSSIDKPVSSDLTSEASSYIQVDKPASSDLTSQGCNITEVDGPAQRPVLQENTTGRGRSQVQGPTPGQMGIGVRCSRRSRPPHLPDEIKNALLEKVRSLTPEQLNLLPLEQREQVLELQKIFR